MTIINIFRRDNSIADALLFDEGMTVHVGIQQTRLRHGVKINTRSRYTHIYTVEPLYYGHPQDNVKCPD